MFKDGGKKMAAVAEFLPSQESKFLSKPEAVIKYTWAFPRISTQGCKQLCLHVLYMDLRAAHVITHNLLNRVETTK